MKDFRELVNIVCQVALDIFFLGRSIPAPVFANNIL